MGLALRRYLFKCWDSDVYLDCTGANNTILVIVTLVTISILFFFSRAGYFPWFTLLSSPGQIILNLSRLRDLCSCRVILDTPFGSDL